MKTIFSAGRKALKKPQFVCVAFVDRQPDYSLLDSRKSRNRYGKGRGIAYAINVYPKTKDTGHAAT